MSNLNKSGRTGLILRFDSSDQGTFGALLLEGKFFCYTAELPWRDNQPNYSCIPAGTYTCNIIKSPKFGTVYQVQDVEGRTYIEFHSGNFVGDVLKRLKTDSEGCILPGNSIGELQGQQAVTASRFTLKKLMDELAGADVEMTIKDCYE